MRRGDDCRRGERIGAGYFARVRYKRNPAVTASRVDLPPTQTEHSFAAIPFPLGPSQSLPRFQVSLAIASFLQFRHICPPPFDADALGR